MVDGNCGQLANKTTNQKAPSPREFGRTRFTILSNVTRIHEERGLGGEEQETYQLPRRFFLCDAYFVKVADAIQPLIHVFLDLASVPESVVLVHWSDIQNIVE